VAGPLAPFADGLRGALAGQGYAGDTITDHVHLLADLSGWLGGQGSSGAFRRGGPTRWPRVSPGGRGCRRPARWVDETAGRAPMEFSWVPPASPPASLTEYQPAAVAS